ncbi:Nucleophile aminohydrolase [Naviculisporaceae sp. PSN 640]
MGGGRRSYASVLKEARNSTHPSPLSGDSTVDRIWRRVKPPVAAIFIHAGAGFHSLGNEKVHLDACAEAARIGMKLLRQGASAPEAVEAAIKCLEDKEITNAGYGSNLNMDGVVECDATVVDHLGRSGACGAVPGIKNPISLAKMILDASSQPLSLRRVPPNILVGLGAKLFAEEHGMAATTNSLLVSRNAKDRYLRWNDDLKRAEAKSSSSNSTPVLRKHASATECEATECEGRQQTQAPTGPGMLAGHAAAILTGTWNEGQPDSPCSVGSVSTPPADFGSGPAPTPRNTPRHASPRTTPPVVPKAADRNPLDFIVPAIRGQGLNLSAKRPTAHKSLSDDPISLAARTAGNAYADGNFDGAVLSDPDIDNQHGDDDDDPDTDKVTDTVGAIAIDLRGFIAAGSSSGGIGMKHSGRIGPAALVGVGSAVIPEDPEDVEQTSVAAVTSGTGEHMATTLASAKCCERLFHGTRRGPGGRNIEETDDQALMEAFINDDFMGHPGVKNQPSTGAIGVMAVKKDRSGIYFYFAHNTDSFALASMSSTERDPLCVMSRLGKSRMVSQGARKIRTD